MTRRAAYAVPTNLRNDDETLSPVAQQIFQQLYDLSRDGPGITREAFGERETAAHELIATHARQAGLPVERDRAGNLVVTLDGRESGKPFIAIGSHLDSVPRGGNYDGAAGVVAGLLALITLQRGGVVPPQTVKLMALRGEESAWFGKSWIGSHALFGLLSASDLAQPRADTGRPMSAYLHDVGADVAAIAAREELLDPGTVGAFLELHIEQGPVLDALQIPLGVVTAIYGNLRHRRLVCRGEAAHAGTTPRALRHDAVVATADFIMRVDRNWSDWLGQGKQLVVTHGILETNAREHAISRVPGEVTASLEIRADDVTTLEGFHALAQSEARVVARERGVSFDFDAPIINEPAQMDARWRDRLEALCDEERVAHMRLPSGAGHDAAVFSHVGIPTAMLLIRNQFGSHNPDERMELPDLLAATRVLTRALLAVARTEDL